MAENDIYGSKEKYERFIARICDLTKPRPERVERRGQSRYFCKNAINLTYFSQLVPSFNARDLSYARRLRLFRTLTIVTHATERDLSACDREDINRIVGFAQSMLPAAKSKGDFIKDVKLLWRTLLPDKDERGRTDETAMPYVVRHLSAKIDKSKEKLRNEKLTLDEFETLLQSFSTDKRLQAFIALSVESLRRPQELLYVRIRDTEILDNFAKLWIASHGKEGPGLAQCIDSFPYLAAWYNEHPLRHDPNAYLFLNIGDTKRYGQLKPGTINKHLRLRLKALGIRKRITCYSFKRNGVTIRRLRGDSDVSIQRAAGWTSTRQMRAYDLSDAEDAFTIELVKRGIVQDRRYEQFRPMSRDCLFCTQRNGISEAVCSRCKRPLDREKVEKDLAVRNDTLVEERKERERVQNELSELRTQLLEINRVMNRLVNANPEIIDVMARAAVRAQRVGAGDRVRASELGAVEKDALQDA